MAEHRVPPRTGKLAGEDGIVCPHQESLPSRGWSGAHPDPKTDGLQRLNEVGSFIWALIAERTHTASDIEAVLQSFEVSLRTADVATFLDNLAAKELIRYSSNWLANLSSVECPVGSGWWDLTGQV